MNVRPSSASPAVALAIALVLGTLLSLALFAGIQISLRWTVYILIVPIGFAALFLSRSPLLRFIALLVPLLVVEDTLIYYREAMGLRLSVSQPLAVVIFASAAMRNPGGLARLGRYGIAWAMIILFAALAALRGWGSADWPLEQDRLVRWYVEGLLYFVLGMAIVRRPADGRLLLWVLGGVGVLFALLHFQFALTGSSELSPAPTNFETTRQWRYGGPLLNPNNLACYQAMFIPTLLVLALSSRRLVGLGAFGMAAAGLGGSLVLTGSRGGLLSALFAVVMLLAFVQRRRGSGGVLIPVVATVMFTAYHMLTALVPDLFAQSVERYQERGLEDVRTVLWEYAADMVVENPLGLGLAHTHFVDELVLRSQGLYFASPHNIYLGTMTTIGLQGFAALALLVGGVFVGADRALRSGRLNRSEHLTIAALLAAMTGFMASGVTEPVFYNSMKLHHVFFLVMGAVVAMSRGVLARPDRPVVARGRRAGGAEDPGGAREPPPSRAGPGRPSDDESGASRVGSGPAKAATSPASR